MTPQRLALVLCVALAGCPAEEVTDPTEAPTETAFECDPVGADPVVGELLNAPLDDDVEVIEKVPQHPGDPGPDGLP